MPHLIPFLPEHAMKIWANAVESVEEKAAAEAAERYRTMGPAFSAVNAQGDIIGCGGLLMLSPRSAHAWTILDRDLALTVSPRWLYRTITSRLRELREELHLRRVQTDCEVDNPIFAQFILNIGFRQEGILRKYGMTGKDHIMFSIIEGE